jgi:DNA-binding CsgD family transcriptional regulator
MPTTQLRHSPSDIVAALESLPVPAFTIAANETIAWQNHAAVGAIGDVVGKRYTVMVAPDSVAAVQAFFTQKRLGEALTTEYELTMIAADGARVPVEMSTVADPHDGHFVGVFGVFRPEEDLPPPKAPQRELTPRQAEALRLLAHGRSTAQMADAMGVSVDTVRNHVRDLLKRLGVHSRLEAVVRARELDLL